jgi:hypothetical protein
MAGCRRPTSASEGNFARMTVRRYGMVALLPCIIASAAPHMKRLATVAAVRLLIAKWHNGRQAPWKRASRFSTNARLASLASSEF